MTTCGVSSTGFSRDHHVVRWTGLIGAGLSIRLAARARRLSNRRWWGRNAAGVQRRTLRALLARAAATEVGREYRFGRLACLREGQVERAYRAAVPLADYEAWRPRMQRMREGAERDIAWPGLVMDWAQTSGTTGGQKYIPVSREMMRSNFRAAMDIFAHAERFGVSLVRLFSGRLLFLGGSTSLSVGKAGIRTGDLSGLVVPMIRWPLSAVYSPGREVALIDHWPTKMEAMARQTAAQDVRCVSGMASWALVLFERVVSTTGAGCLREVWPNLELFVHGGVKYGPFDPRVREAWSGSQGRDVPCRLEVYPASEGFIAVQDVRGDPGLRLHTDLGNYYEFVPLEEIDRADARAFSCGEVERGQRYVVVMTTCAGLWRYVLGDVVEFDTIPPDGPPRLRIVGRHRHFINAFGENLIVEDIERAVMAAREAAGAAIGEFTAGPIYPANGRRAGLELVVEWQGDTSGVARFADVFDASLRAGNVDYDTKRTGDLGMAPAVVSPVPAGVFHRWMESRGRLGGQNKAPRCANHREFVEGVLAVAGDVAQG